MRFLGKVPKWMVALVAVISFAVIMILIAIQSTGELADLGVRRITGFPLARDYLVIFQNNAERRPTGGFITAYGILRFRGGIPSLEFGNVYDEKLIQAGVSPPDPTIAKLLSGPFFPGHGFRDGNFDPDFPTAAEELMRLYRLGFPDANFDGVIALDFTAFENLAAALAPEIAGEIGLFMTLENLVQNVDLHDPAALATRKNFLGDLAKSLMRKAVFSPKKAAQSLIASLNAKHALLYFDDVVLQFRAHEKGWTAELPVAGDADLLVINEGNYGGMKSSRYILRTIFYDVEFMENADGTFTPIADLRIVLAHRGDAAEPISGFYKSFWRVYAPLGSNLISGEIDRAYDDTRRQIWGKVITMNPGETREINLRYELPAAVFTDQNYRLRLVRQPGSDADHFRVTVKLPAGFQTVSTDFDTRENLAIFETNLARDRELVLQVLPDRVPPRLAWQEFYGGIDEIDLRFNEPLSAESVAAAEFSIADLNFRNQQTDPVSITRVRFVPPQNIRLNLRGVSAECREWYELQIAGIADVHGNSLENQKITIVQWLDSAGEICDPQRQL